MPVLAILLLLAGACHKKASVRAPGPPATTPSPPLTKIPTTPLPPPRTARLPSIPTPVPLRVFQAAEKEFENGDYEEAARDYEQYLEMPDPKNRPRALFRLGMSRALSGKPKDLRLSEAAFRSLIADFPDNPYRDQAELIVSLQSQIERLKADVRSRDDKIRLLADELQKLKEIDMQRRPSRPPPPQ